MMTEREEALTAQQAKREEVEATLSRLRTRLAKIERNITYIEEGGDDFERFGR